MEQQTTPTAGRPEQHPDWEEPPYPEFADCPDADKHGPDGCRTCGLRPLR